MRANFFKKFKKTTSGQFQGFTLVEALIAVAIITTGLIAILGVISYAISISRVSPDEVIAANLAQEGIGVIKNIRDSNWLVDKADNGMRDNSVSWKQDIGQGSVTLSSSTTAPTYLLPGIGNAIACKNNLGTACQLFLDSDGLYSHDSSGEPTKFYRLIRIVEQAGGTRLRVTSWVAWQVQGGDWRQISVRDILRDYEVITSPVVKYRWDETGAAVNCLDLKQEEGNADCFPLTGSGEYHHNRKCARCCIGGNCNDYDAGDPFNGEFLYISPWDHNGDELNPGLEESPDVPAFYSDPSVVCDIYDCDTGSCKCRVFEKIAY